MSMNPSHSQARSLVTVFLGSHPHQETHHHPRNKIQTPRHPGQTTDSLILTHLHHSSCHLQRNPSLSLPRRLLRRRFPLNFPIQRCHPRRSTIRRPEDLARNRCHFRRLSTPTLCCWRPVCVFERPALLLPSLFLVPFVGEKTFGDPHEKLRSC